MRYVPLPIPFGDFRAWIAGELQRIGEAFRTMDEVQLEVLTAPPLHPRAGMLVYADGTHWNPGAGAGFYGYVGTAWQKL